MKPTPLEKLEKLEQLRALENRCPIKVTAVQYEPLCVDIPEDVQKVVEHLTQRHSSLSNPPSPGSQDS